MPYKVINPGGATVLRSLSTWEEEGVTRYRHTSSVQPYGKTLSDDEVSPVQQDRVKNGDDRNLAYVDDEGSVGQVGRLLEPFPGYNNLDVTQVRQAIANLPSEAIQRIKEYEAENENRVEIVEYQVGFGESTVDREQGVVSSDVDKAQRTADKPSSALGTREVGEDYVEGGEGYTGTGEPVRPYGSRAKKRAEAAAAKSSPKTKTTRRSTKKDADSNKE